MQRRAAQKGTRSAAPTLAGETRSYRLRRSRRALRFLLPILRRRRGLAMHVSFHVSKAG